MLSKHELAETSWLRLTDLLCPILGSRISAAHFPQGRCRTPLYVLSLPLLTTRSSATGLPDDKIVAPCCASLHASPVLGSCMGGLRMPQALTSGDTTEHDTCCQYATEARLGGTHRSCTHRRNVCGLAQQACCVLSCLGSEGPVQCRA